MDCGVSCAKWVMIFINFIFVVTGIAIFSTGVYVYIAYHHYESFIGETLWSIPIVLMILGGVIFFITFLGCCGAIKESSCMVLTFSILLLAIFVFDIAVGVFVYTKRDGLGDMLDEGFNKTLDHYSDNKEAWDFVQEKFKCCGIRSPDDWAPIFPNGSLPESCCSQNPENSCKMDSSDKYLDGCAQKLLDFIKPFVKYFGAFVIGIGLLQIVGFGLSCCLNQAFRRRYA